MAMFQILGPVSLFARGSNADLGPAKVRGLLGILLLSADAAVPIDLIVDRLWDQAGEIGNGATPPAGRRPPPNPRKTLQGYVSKLRALLAKAAAPAKVVTGPGYYRLKIDPRIVDYHRFRQLSDEGRVAARQGDHTRAITALEAAIDLWHGRPLADIQSSWSARYGETLVSQDLLPAYYALLEAKLTLNKHDEVLTQLRPLLMTYETDEDLIALRMRALAVVDGPSSVVACFRDYTQKLDEVLDTPPSERLVELYRSLVEQPAAPPPVPARRPPQLIPRDVPHFVGRSDILHQLDTLLVTTDDRPAIVSLDGAPGVGKTAIATHWAHRRRDRFPDGVLYADLAGYGPGTPTGPATVLATFLDALGIAHQNMPRDVSERTSLLRHELTGRRMLVVLDNVFDTGQIEPLLPAMVSCPVLITSRQKLDELAIRDHSITVPTLLVDEAIALLQLRIGEDRVANELAAIHDLAALCSSLPLALRIAGGHIAARPEAPIPDLVRHLRSQHRLLNAGTTQLRALFDWSTDALPPDPERLFALLGVHPTAQVSTQAAAALTGWSIERTERAFGRLIDAHLAQQHGGDQFRLHDLLHDYADDRAHRNTTPAERHAAVHRLVDWYLHTAANAVRQVAPQWKPVPSLALGTDVRPQTFGDAQTALAWCVSQRPQALAVSRCALEHRFYQHVWRLIGVFDEILNRFGDPSDSIDIHRAALEAARTTGERDGEAGSLNNLGVIHFYLGDYESAADYYAQALKISQELGDEASECIDLYNIGTAQLERGRYQQALGLYQDSLVIAERIDDKTSQARVHHRLGEVYQRLERPTQAEEFYRRALDIRIEIGDSRNQAATLTKLGELSVERGDQAEAIAFCEQALQISRDTYDQRKAAEALCTRAMALYKLGDHDESIASAQESAVLCHTMSDARGEARALEILAQAREATGDRSAADHSRARALSLIPDSSDPIVTRIRAALSSTGLSESEVPAQREKSGSKVV